MTQIQWRRCDPDLVRQYRQLVRDSMLNRQPCSAAGVVVAWCVIALAPEERSGLHCSEHAAASGCCRMEYREARRCSSQALTVSDYRQTSVQVDQVDSRWRMWRMAIAQCEVTAEVTLNRPLLIFTRIDYPSG